MVRAAPVLAFLALVGAASAELLFADQAEVAPQEQRKPSYWMTLGKRSFLDHNYKMCNQCSKPDKSRLAPGVEYKVYRTDCGMERKSVTDFGSQPLHKLKKTGAEKKSGLESNAFCELNFRKSCADAIANKDYMYFAKSMDVRGSKKLQTYDGQYCLKNNFLGARQIRESHIGGFEALMKRGKHLCKKKYAKFDWENITMSDIMMQYGSSIVLKHIPTEQDAEFMAAWNCAMGDLACDMAYCAYTYCKKGKDKAGSYEECEGWDPVLGMMPWLERRELQHKSLELDYEDKFFGQDVDGGKEGDETDEDDQQEDQH